jgi:hypothetical protein
MGDQERQAAIVGLKDDDNWILSVKRQMAKP